MRQPGPWHVHLRALKAAYDNPEALEQDPLSRVLHYTDPMDQEAAAWVAAHLAYGRVGPMLKAIDRVLVLLGPHPARALRAGDLPHWKAVLGDWKWRFHTGDDLACWLEAWRRLDAESRQGLAPHLEPRHDQDPDEPLSNLVQRLRRELPPSHGLRFSLPDPQEGAACKRWRMFLRWMVRRNWPDLGCWTAFLPSALIIPLDTHVARVSRLVGLTDRRTPDGRMAREITQNLALVDPEDPLAYDFALSHLGILGDCTGHRSPETCPRCPLAPICRARKER